MLPVNNITDKIGIWNSPQNEPCSWMIRKHPGLSMLSAAETEKTRENEEGEGADDGH